MSNPTHVEFIQGLRDLAQFYSEHPEVKLPNSRSLSIYYLTREEILTTARAFGTAKKQFSSDSFWLKKEFSGGLRLEVFTDRATVCERVVVDTKLVPEERVPARVIPEHEEEVVRWDCHPLLAEKEEPLTDSDIPF